MLKDRAKLAMLTGSVLWLCAAYAYSSKEPAPPLPPTPAQADFFETKVRPVLAQNCQGCHGKDSQGAGLRLDSLEAMTKGGSSGAAVIPGDPDHSLIIKAINQAGNLKMPPTGVKLPANQIADLTAWVKMGAPWPAAAISASAKPLWSLQPITHPAVPKVKEAAWPLDPIDNFVLAKLEAEHQKHDPAADKRTLLRRVTYDLIGLPPTPEEMDAFMADKSPDAYSKVVDRLLASPHYGERMARHWMDVARYADTKGYVFTEDRNYPNAYTYRTWLIQAFNKDLPYDRFIVQQLAADKLPEVQSKTDLSPLAAMGYLTLGRRFLNSEPDIVDDRIDVTMRGMEGFTVECARCHDHKFDPIPTQDYYSLYAVFASSEDKTLPISPGPIATAWEQYDQKRKDLTQQGEAVIAAQTKRLREQPPASLSADVRQVLQTVGVNAVPADGNLEKIVGSFEPDERAKLMAIQKQVEELDINAPPAPELAGALVDKPNPSDGVVFHHGNPGNPGIAAPRRFLLALSKPGVERTHWTDGSGRLELAESIASKDNPLTARVFVNRVWQDHFGAGIVRTPSDFGHQGEPPTDPKLLDYLASSFMDGGWSIKKLQRLLVMSATYRQSSAVTPSAFNDDPDNRNWGRMNRRRLDMEQMRDSVMMASDNLKLDALGGKSVDLWTEPFTPRRAVYGFVERQNLDAVFRTFDFASPDSTSAKRFQTTVPQQALFFMNSPFVVQSAEGIAKLPEVSGSKDEGQRVRRLYRLLFQRLPDKSEQSVGVGYLGQPAPGDLSTISPWRYGYGQVDLGKGRVVQFQPFVHFAEDRYYPGDKFPDPQFGYVCLFKTAGHPGRDSAHDAIRRWVAPSSGRVQIDGELIHGQQDGDGVEGRIVSSSQGLLGTWQVHNGKAWTTVKSTFVNKGDTIDFAVDCRTGDNSDSFQWAPTIRKLDGTDSWDAASGFSGPPKPPLDRVALYVQALMMTNEFMFLD